MFIREKYLRNSGKVTCKVNETSFHKEMPGFQSHMDIPWRR